MKSWTKLSVWMLALLLVGCQGKKQQKEGAKVEEAQALVQEIKPKYAEGFRVTYTEEGCLLDIQFQHQSSQ